MEQQLCQCLAVDAPNNNFGWLRKGFCNDFTEQQKSGSFTGLLKKVGVYYDTFRNTLKTCCPDDDIVHDAIYDALEKFPYMLKKATRRGTWLCYGNLQGLFYVTAKSFVFEELRRRKRFVGTSDNTSNNDLDLNEADFNDLFDAEQTGFPQSDVEDVVGEAQEKIADYRLLEESVDWLRTRYPKYYAVFDLKVNAGLSHEDIALQLGINLSDSQQTHIRAKKKLKEKMVELSHTAETKTRTIVSRLKS